MVSFEAHCSQAASLICVAELVASPRQADCPSCPVSVYPLFAGVRAILQGSADLSHAIGVQYTLKRIVLQCGSMESAAIQVQCCLPHSLNHAGPSSCVQTKVSISQFAGCVLSVRLVAQLDVMSLNSALAETHGKHDLTWLNRRATTGQSTTEALCFANLLFSFLFIQDIHTFLVPS